MILASIQPSNNRIALVSFMRDMYVSIPDYGMNRLNTAYSFGGVELLEETLMKNFDVGFDNYVVIDFDGFIKSIASVGGLEIELTEAEAGEVIPEGMSVEDYIPSVLKTENWSKRVDWNYNTIEQTCIKFDKLRPVHPELDAKRFWSALFFFFLQAVVYISDSAE